MTRKKASVGRPSKLTPKLKASLVSHIESGCTFKDACEMENISVSSFNEWRREIPAFSAAIKKAEVGFKKTHLLNIGKASMKHWQASAWLLERKFKKEFSTRYEHEPPEENKIDLLGEAMKRAAKFKYPKGQKSCHDKKEGA